MRIKIVLSSRFPKYRALKKISAKRDHMHEDALNQKISHKFLIFFS